MSEPPIRTGIARGRRLTAITALMCSLVVATAVGVAGVLLAERSGARLDLTAAGEQQLSPRTLGLLDAAAEQTRGVRAIVVGPVSGVDPRARREVLDVLDLVEAHRAVSVTVLDTASPNGAVAYQQLVDDLSADHAAELDAFASAIVRGVETARSLAEWLTGTLSPRLADLARAEPARVDWLTQTGAAARILARDLEQLAQQADTAREAMSPVTLASANDTRQALADQLSSIALQLESLGPAIASIEQGRPLSESIARQRDVAAVAADSLSRTVVPPVVRAARALERGEGVLLLAEGRVAALAFDDVFVSTGGARTDLRRSAEGALASALAAMLDDHRPLVVLMHAELAPVLDRFRGFDGVLDRLAARGIDVIEWPAGASGAPPPNLSSIDPTGLRPVVYVTLAPDSAARARGDDPSSSGPVRATAMSATLGDLIARGERLLISLNPSSLPAMGTEDPVAASLRPLGVRALTGTPLMSESYGPAGRSAQIEAVALASGTDHPLARALQGLPTLFPWPIGLESPSAAIYSLSGENRWAESEWFRIWTTPHSQRAPLLQQTEFDAERETGDGPWTLATAIERRVNDETQRVVVVGSNGWFADAVALGRGEIDGRSVLLHPGNIELLESSVLWLAGRDREVAPSAQARAVPLIRPIDADSLRWLRWGLILGLPFGVLIVGGVWRLIRG
ncbi:MAG: hypothetical protein KDB18_08500 [Salinibacterium sp.]|nr:hypothetical protein [Salinibacterium sp.]